MKEQPSRRFSIAFSGGSLPALVCPQLAALLNQRKNVDLSGWSIFFADERFVGLDDPESNYLPLKKYFLDPLALPQNALPRIHALDMSLTLDQNVARYVDLVKADVVCDGAGRPRFDVILLGMGPDGHTASLFPHHALLKVGEAIVEKIQDSPKPPSTRITMTLPVLNSAKNAYFVCTGEGKQKALREVLEAEPSEEYPSSLVHLHDGKLDWYVDAPAAKLLSNL